MSLRENEEISRLSALGKRHYEKICIVGTVSNMQVKADPRLVIWNQIRESALTSE
jgi:hypothetical protein